MPDTRSIVEPIEQPVGIASGRAAGKTRWWPKVEGGLILRLFLHVLSQAFDGSQCREVWSP